MGVLDHGSACGARHQHHVEDHDHAIDVVEWEHADDPVVGAERDVDRPGGVQLSSKERPVQSTRLLTSKRELKELLISNRICFTLARRLW